MLLVALKKSQSILMVRVMNVLTGCEPFDEMKGKVESDDCAPLRRHRPIHDGQERSIAICFRLVFSGTGHVLLTVNLKCSIESKVACQLLGIAFRQLRQMH